MPSRLASCRFACSRLALAQIRQHQVGMLQIRLIEDGILKPGVDQIGACKAFARKVRLHACLAIGVQPIAVLLEGLGQSANRSRAQDFLLLESRYFRRSCYDFQGLTPTCASRFEISTAECKLYKPHGSYIVDWVLQV